MLILKLPGILTHVFGCTRSTATSGIRVRLGEWNMKDTNEPYPHEDFDIERKEVNFISS